MVGPHVSYGCESIIENESKRNAPSAQIEAPSKVGGIGLYERISPGQIYLVRPAGRILSMRRARQGKDYYQDQYG